MITSSFLHDIEFIFNKLKNEDYFSFSKYADGEYKILRNEYITNCDNWTFNPAIHHKQYELLMESFKYNHEDYYVGISCPCCRPMDDIRWMRDNVGTDNVTWANLFVNSNYKFFLDNFIEEFKKWNNDIIFVGNSNGLGKKLPFNIQHYVGIHPTGWYDSLEPALKETSEYARRYCDKLFLFSAGPLGNILAHQLHLINKKNIYIDIGSTINPWIVGNNRGYLNGNNISKTCIW